jgi:hypothetical protein
MPSDTNYLLCNMPDKLDFWGGMSLHCVDVGSIIHPKRRQHCSQSHSAKTSNIIKFITRIQETLGLNTGPETIYTD